MSDDSLNQRFLKTVTDFKTRNYLELCAIAEAHGGRMWYENEGYYYGAWFVELDGLSAAFTSDGVSYPELDRLYVPKVPEPEHALDYTSELVENAEAEFLELLERKQGEV